jgi:hypothetical protein
MTDDDDDAIIGLSDDDVASTGLKRSTSCLRLNCLTEHSSSQALAMPLGDFKRKREEDSTPRVEFPEGMKVLHNSDRLKVDPCFVYGLTGDRERT